MLWAGIHERVCISGDARLQGAGVTWSGGMVSRQRHHSGLWCDVFTTELNVEGGKESRSLTARKHTLESTDRLCKPVPNQESGNSFSYLVWSILMDCVATLGQDLHLELPLHLANSQIFIQSINTSQEQQFRNRTTKKEIG